MLRIGQPNHHGVRGRHAWVLSGLVRHICRVLQPLQEVSGACCCCPPWLSRRYLAAMHTSDFGLITATPSVSVPSFHLRCVTRSWCVAPTSGMQPSNPLHPRHAVNYSPCTYLLLSEPRGETSTKKLRRPISRPTIPTRPTIPVIPTRPARPTSCLPSPLRTATHSRKGRPWSYKCRNRLCRVNRLRPPRSTFTSSLWSQSYSA